MLYDIVLHPSSPISVSADREKIGEVIQNLLSNAIKYSSHGKSIEVSVKESEGQFEFQVIDQGSGIKTTDKENIFNRFYRVDNGDLKSIPGFGLGLYLSAEIIKHHKRKIWVESDFGKGSTFYFSLPLKN